MAQETQNKSNVEKLQEAVLALQLRREQLQLEDLERNKADRIETEENAKKARLIGASALAKQRESEFEFQSQCPHLKPNAQPAIAGQWDHHSNYHWICAYCSKEWDNDALPIHLRIDAGKVGGPNRI